MFTNYLNNLSLITEQNQFDFVNFWEKGGFAFIFDRPDLLSKLADQILYRETFVRETDCNNPSELAIWETDWRKKENPPLIYTEIGEALLRSPLFKSYTDIYGEFTYSKYMLHKTPKDYINGYHSHFFNGNHLIILMYFCPEQRGFEDGGLIELGEVYNKKDISFDLNSFVHTDNTQVIPLQSYIPQTGLVVCANNLNPFFRHGVTRVLTDKPRYAFQIGFGYKDNCHFNKDIKYI
ncbi:MAG: hypothetical protein ACK4VO_06770 [Pseudobdellovibrio sp.]